MNQAEYDAQDAKLKKQWDLSVRKMRNSWKRYLKSDWRRRIKMLKSMEKV